MSLDYRIEIQCDDCGKDITQMRDSETYCYNCHEELKDKIDELEKEIDNLKFQLSKE